MKTAFVTLAYCERCGFDVDFKQSTTPPSFSGVLALVETTERAVQDTLRLLINLDSGVVRFNVMPVFAPGCRSGDAAKDPEPRPEPPSAGSAG